MPKLYQISAADLAARPAITIMDRPKPIEEQIEWRSARSASSSPTRSGKGFTGAILAEIEKGGFKIVAIKKHLSPWRRRRGFTCARPAPISMTCALSCPPAALSYGFEKDNAMRNLREVDGRDQSRQCRRGDHPQKIRGLPSGKRHSRF